MSVIMDLRPVAHAAGDDSLPAPLDLWGDARPLPAWVRAVAYDLDVDELVDVIIGRCLGIAFPSQALDEDFSARLAASTRANANCLRSVIAGEIAIEDVYPRKVLSFATVQAQLRIPQKSMQRCYRISFCAHVGGAGSRDLRRVIVNARTSARTDEVVLRSAAADPDDPGLPGLRGLPSRRDLHARLRGAQSLAGAHAAEPGPGDAARRGRPRCR